MRLGTLLALSAGLCAGIATASTTAPVRAIDSIRDGRVGVYYFKEWREMPVDTTRIAVRSEAGAAFDAALIRAGLKPEDAEAQAIRGWWLVGVPAGRTTLEIARLVLELAATPAVEFVSPVLITADGLPMWATPGVMAGYVEGVEQGARDAMSVMAGATPAAGRRWENFPDMDYMTVEAKDGYTVLEAANTLAAMPEATFAEVDMMFTGRSNFIPNDALFGDLWGLHNTGQSGGAPDMDMDGPEAWDVTTGSASIMAVVMDMGVQQAHPDLNMGPGADFTGNGTNGEPLNQCDNHGTSVASCISGRINNGIGITGIAPGCRSASAKIGVSQTPCNGFWNGSLSWTADAINWGQSIGARVTNNSNSTGPSAAVETAYNNTHNTMVHFASAGNGGVGSLAYPSSIPVVNSVAALTRTGARAGFSQWGPGLDFSAPGQSIDCADRTGAAGYVAGDYVILDGTSFAGPYAAGVACLVLSKNPSLTPAQVESIMQASCMNLGPAGYDTDFGWGFVNAAAALAATPSPGPGNDNCASAVDVSSQGTFNGTLDFATSDGAGSCGSSAGNPDVWYRFTSPNGAMGGTLRVSTCGSNDANGIDTVVSLHSACGAASFVCNDDNNGECGASDVGTWRDSYVTAGMTPGQTVWIRVSKFGGSGTGPFRLNVSYEIVNDSCANAIEVSAGGTYTGTLIGATSDGPGICGASEGNPDVWYTYTQGACPGRVNFNTCGSNASYGIDTVVSAFDGCGGAVLACNDDASSVCAGTLNSSISLDLAAGQTVKVRVSKYLDRAITNFTLNVSSGVGSNDSCGSALTVTDGVYTVCNTLATTDGPTEAGCGFCCNDLQVNNDMWYRYVAPASGVTTVDTTSSPTPFDTKLAVYANGCPAGPNTAIACNDDIGGAFGTLSYVQFNATAGRTYLIRFGGYSTARGTAALRIQTRADCPADFNGDGFLDFFDYDDYINCFENNVCPPGRSADFNGDGFVDFFDYDDFVTAYETGC